MIGFKSAEFISLIVCSSYVTPIFVTAAVVIVILIFIFSPGFLGITPNSAKLSDQVMTEQIFFTRTRNP